MKKTRLWLTAVALLWTAAATAHDTTEDEATATTDETTADTCLYRIDMPEMELNIPEMDPRLVAALDKGYRHKEEQYTMPLRTGTDKYRITWMRTNPGVRPYKVMDDMTFVGVPLFLAGWGIKGDKAMFRVNNKDDKKNTQLLTDFKTSIDDYTQFFGPAMVVGLKLGGMEGRSDWGRLLASAGMSYAFMALFVNSIKYSAKEMRPDGSTANSWPSGHTATSFVGATLLHKEYGLTRSPWFSVAGYGVATATGVMRVLNNRHWVSDVMSGAGLGILSTELGYALGDLIFKGRGLLRNDLVTDNETPSFFGISMGVGLGHKSIEFELDDLEGIETVDWDDDMEVTYVDEDGEEYDEGPLVQFRAATVVDAEGAYFFNKYVGVGGRLRVRAMSAKSFGKYSELSDDEKALGWSDVIGAIYDDEEMFNKAMMEGGSPIKELGGVVKSDHLAEFSASLGLYFNIPLGNQFSLGSKVLIGRSFTQELDIDGYASGKVKDIDYHLVIDHGTPAEGTTIDYPKNQGGDYETTWDYLTIGARNSTTWGTGLSLSYRYKSNFAWKLFVDYDITRKDFTMTYDPCYYLREGLTPEAYALVASVSPSYSLLEPFKFKHRQTMNYVTLGLSFMVNL